MDRLEIFSFASAEFLTVFIFLFIILLSFLKYMLVQNQPGNRDVQKIIGGLSVFIVAILSQSWQVAAVSLLIGGLIIASEEFMEKLAIILRSESKDIGTNLSVTKAEPKEVKDKLKEEVGREPKDLRKANLANTHVFAYLKEKYGALFEPEVKITTENQELIVDGVIKTENDDLQSVVEIRYEPSVTPGQTRQLIDLTKTRIQSVLPEQHITLCLVVKEKPTAKIKDIPEDVLLLIFKLKRGGVSLLE